MIEAWAKFCAQMGADFSTFDEGLDLLREDFWIDRGFSAVLSALESTHRLANQVSK